MSLDYDDVTSIKYPHYLRKNQRTKLKLNDSTINNQLPGIQVSSCDQSGNITGKTSTIHSNSINILKKNNKIIYRLPTTTDILRSKNINVPKVKKIDPQSLKSRHVENEISTTSNKSMNVRKSKIPLPAHIIDIKLPESSEISVQSEIENLVNSISKKDITNESVNVQNQICTDWSKIKQNESWRDRVKEMVSKQITLDSISDGGNCSQYIFRNRNICDSDDSIKSNNDSYDLKLTDDYSSVSYSGNNYERIKFDYSTNISPSKFTEKIVNGQSSQNNINNTDKKGGKQHDLSQSSDINLILKSQPFYDTNTIRNNSVVSDQKNNDVQSNIQLNPTSSVNVQINNIFDELLDNVLKIVSNPNLKNVCKSNENVSNEKITNDFNNDFNDSQLTDLNNNVQNNQLIGKNNLLAIIDDIEKIYENIQEYDQLEYIDYPWTFLDDILLRSKNRAQSSGVVIKELPDSEIDTQEEENEEERNQTLEEKSNIIIRNNLSATFVEKHTAKNDLTLIYERGKNQFKLISSDNIPVWVIIYNCLYPMKWVSSFFPCPLILTKKEDPSISKHLISLNYSFTKVYRNRKTHKLMKKIINNFNRKSLTLLPLRKYSNHKIIKEKAPSSGFHHISLEDDLSNYSTQLLSERPEILDKKKLGDEESRTFLTNLDLHSDQSSDNEIKKPIEYEQSNILDLTNIDTKPSSTIATWINETSKHDDINLENSYTTNIDNKSDRTDTFHSDIITDLNSELSSDEFTCEDVESKYFASCSSINNSEIDNYSEKSYRRNKRSQYLKNDNFTIHKKKVEYYETIEYKKNQDDYQTVKTSCVKLPLLNSCNNNNNLELTRNWNFPWNSPYTTKWTENNRSDKSDRLPRKYCRPSKPKSLVRLPPLAPKINKRSTSDDLPESVDNKESVDKKSVGNATIDSAYSSLTRVLSEGDSTKVEQARFCHECGTQYPVPVAKFCCYCGMRRITL